MSDLLFDTCTVIWTGIGESIDENAVSEINQIYHSGQRIYVSLFSAWELGLLVARSRLKLERPVTDWFEEYVTKSRISIAELTPNILINSSFLPGTPPTDPVDRIIIATARAMNLTIVTRDRSILRYAVDGHVRALVC